MSLVQRRSEHQAQILPRPRDKDGKEWDPKKQVVDLKLCVAEILKRERAKMRADKCVKKTNDRRILDMMVLAVSELAMEIARLKNGSWHEGKSQGGVGSAAGGWDARVGEVADGDVAGLGYMGLGFRV